MIINRPYNNDYNNILKFLRENIAKRTCWLPQKLEYAVYMCSELEGHDFSKTVRIWEDDNKMVAIFHTESGVEEGFFEISDGYEYLHKEMLEWAIMNIENLKPFAYNSLTYQIEELTKKGYKKIEEPTFQNIIHLEDKDIKTSLPNEYEFVDKKDVEDVLQRQFAVHRGFHPDDKEIKDVPLNYLEAFKVMEQAPLFKDELEIMIKHNDKYIGLLVLWIDEEKKQGLIEPLSIFPEYQGKGLGKQLIYEALKRAKKLGINTIYVESYGERRKKFYNDCGFITYDECFSYKK